MTNIIPLSADEREQLEEIRAFQADVEKPRDTDFGIEASDWDPQMLRLFNVETGKRSCYFSGNLYRDMWGNLVPPAWAFKEIS